MHEMVLMKSRVRELKEANTALSKRERAKKSRIQAGGPLIMQDISNILAKRDIYVLVGKEKRLEGNRTRGNVVGSRHCGNYGKTGHNSCTC